MHTILSSLTLAACAAVAGATAGAAQEVALKGFLARSSFAESGTGTNPWDEALTSTGFGLHARFGFGPIALQPELQVVTRGATKSAPTVEDEDLRIEYLELPVLLVVPVRLGRLEPYAFGGGMVALESRCRYVSREEGRRRRRLISSGQWPHSGGGASHLGAAQHRVRRPYPGTAQPHVDDRHWLHDQCSAGSLRRRVLQRACRRWYRSAAAGFAITAVVGTVSCAAPAVESGPARTRVAAAAELLYVCNQNDATVTVIDLAANVAVRTVDLQRLGFTANARPHHIAVEPDGSFWYVTLIGDNRVVKLDRDDRVVAQVAFETPGMLALHPSQDLLFVGRSMTAVNPPPRIGVLRRSDLKLDELDVNLPRPHALAVEPRSGTVYTASLAANQLATIDLATERVTLHDVPGPAHALMQAALAPDGQAMAISGELSHKLLRFDLTDRLQPRLAATIDVGLQPFDPIYTNDGRWIFVPNKAANTVTVIDATTDRVIDVIRGAGLAQPHGVATSADGKYVYVSNNNLRSAPAPAGHETHPAGPSTPAGKGTVTVIDVGTRAIVHVIEVGHNASGIGTRTPRR
jgi:YVTN family beta-propeller protein